MKILTRKNQIAIAKHLAAIVHIANNWKDEEWEDFVKHIIYNVIEIATIVGGEKMMSVDVPACIEALRKKVEGGRARRNGNNE